MPACATCRLGNWPELVRANGNVRGQVFICHLLVPVSFGGGGIRKVTLGSALRVEPSSLRGCETLYNEGSRRQEAIMEKGPLGTRLRFARAQAPTSENGGGASFPVAGQGIQV